MNKNDNDVRKNQRLNTDEEDYDDSEIYLMELGNKNLKLTEDTDEIKQNLDLLLSEDEKISSFSLESLIDLSHFFPKNFLQYLSPTHFSVLYNFFQNDEFNHLVLIIFYNLSKENEFSPPPQIFQIIMNFFSNEQSDETELKLSLKLSSNLILLNEVYYLSALQNGIIQAIISMPNLSLSFVKHKISVLSSILKYENHEIENSIFDYILQQVHMQPQNNEEEMKRLKICREALRGFEFALAWSKISYAIINESDLISISMNLLFSEKPKNLRILFSFLNNCIICPHINNLEFIKVLIAKIGSNEEEENCVLEDIIFSFNNLILHKDYSRGFLFSSLSEFGFRSLLCKKTFIVKKMFLLFLNESSKVCPKELMIIPPDDLGAFLEDVIQTGEIDLQLPSYELILSLISSISDLGDSYGEWINAFSHCLNSHNAVDCFYESKIIENPTVSKTIDFLCNFISDHDNS